MAGQPGAFLREAGVLAVVLAVDVALTTATWWALVAWLATAVWWAWTMMERPMVACWRCGGKGLQSKSPLAPWALGTCKRCGNKGRVCRWSVRVLTPARAERLRREHGLARPGRRAGLP